MNLGVDERTFDKHLAFGLWACHMASLVVWISTFVWAWVQQQRMKASIEPRTSEAFLPTQCEVYSLLLLVAYAVFDLLRGLDGCFDGSDGVCRAVFGITPVALRFVFWALRDIVLLWNINELVSFSVGWTHKALGWPQVEGTKRLLRGAFAFSAGGLVCCFAGLCVTNRQSYQAGAVASMIVLNSVWVKTNWDLLKKVIPALESLVASNTELVDSTLTATTPALSTEGSCNAKSEVRRSAAPWVHAAVSQLRSSAALLLTANIAILCVFPCIAFEKLVLKSAHTSPLIPGNALDSWVGSQMSPLVTEKPLGITLNPALELIEIMIGWLLWMYTVRTSTCDDALRPRYGPPGTSPPTCGYISEDAFASALVAEVQPARTKTD